MPINGFLPPGEKPTVTDWHALAGRVVLDALGVQPDLRLNAPDEAG
jgi:hypothetical protein